MQRKKKNLMKTISKNHKKFIAWNVYAWQATSSHFLCVKKQGLKRKIMFVFNVAKGQLCGWHVNRKDVTK